MSRLRAHAPAAAIPVAATALYVLTASRWLVGRSDAAEFAALAARGGVAHPPGYPLYVLWLRAFAWLPLSAAHRASVATALLGGLAVAALQWACRSWGASRAAAAVVAALFAVWRVPWQQATAPEVFSGSVALAMAVVAVAGPRALPELRGPRRVALLGLLAGLGLSNQHTIVLLAPLGLWAAVAEAKGAWARATLAGIAALAVGLLPYAYLPYATAHGLPEECVAGDFRSLSSVLHHFLRAEYGTFRLSAAAGESAPGTQLLWLVKDLGTSLLWCPAAIGLPFVGRRSWPTSRGRLLALVASFVLAGPLFALRMNFPPGTSYLVLAERFHLLPAALLAVLAAVLLEGALERAADGRRTRALAVAGAALLATVRIAWVATDEPWYGPVLERWMANVFRTLPPSALLFARSDPAIGAFMYARCAEEARPDVALVSPNRLFAPWYAERVTRTAGFAYRPVNGTVYAADLLSSALASGRPVFLVDWFAPKLEATFASYPIGPLLRVVPAREQVLDPLRLLAANRALFATFALEDPAPMAGSWAATVYGDYARPFHVLGTTFAAMGAPELAAESENLAQRLTPRRVD